MPADHPVEVRPCPHCGGPARQLADNRDRPFCCRRCRELDLAGWLDGDFRIPGPEVDPAVLSERSGDD